MHFDFSNKKRSPKLQEGDFVFPEAALTKNVDETETNLNKQQSILTSNTTATTTTAAITTATTTTNASSSAAATTHQHHVFVEPKTVSNTLNNLKMILVFISSVLLYRAH